MAVKQKDNGGDPAILKIINKIYILLYITNQKLNKKNFSLFIIIKIKNF